MRHPRRWRSGNREAIVTLRASPKARSSHTINFRTICEAPRALDCHSEDLQRQSHDHLQVTTMSNAGVLLSLAVAALLIVGNFFLSLRRKRRSRADYWLPNGTRLKRKADKP
jgi:hypothetical protein